MVPRYSWTQLLFQKLRTMRPFFLPRCTGTLRSRRSRNPWRWWLKRRGRTASPAIFPAAAAVLDRPKRPKMQECRCVARRGLPFRSYGRFSNGRLHFGLIDLCGSSSYPITLTTRPSGCLLGKESRVEIPFSWLAILRTTGVLLTVSEPLPMSTRRFWIGLVSRNVQLPQASGGHCFHSRTP